MELSGKRGKKNNIKVEIYEYVELGTCRLTGQMEQEMAERDGNR